MNSHWSFFVPWAVLTWRFTPPSTPRRRRSSLDYMWLAVGRSVVTVAVAERRGEEPLPRHGGSSGVGLRAMGEVGFEGVQRVAHGALHERGQHRLKRAPPPQWLCSRAERHLGAGWVGWRRYSPLKVDWRHPTLVKLTRLGGSVPSSMNTS